MNDNIKYQFKIIIVGNTNTGKTCFLHQFIEKKCKFFIKLKLTQTIQLELSLEQKFQKILESNFRFRILQVKKGKINFKIFLRFRSIARTYFRGA